MIRYFLLISNEMLKSGITIECNSRNWLAAKVDFVFLEFAVSENDTIFYLEFAVSEENLIPYLETEKSEKCAIFNLDLANSNDSNSNSTPNVFISEALSSLDHR